MTAFRLYANPMGPYDRVRVFAGVDADHLQLAGVLLLRAGEFDELNARLTAAGGRDLLPADGADVHPLSAAPTSAPVVRNAAGADGNPTEPRQYPCARCGQPLQLPGPTHHECDPKVLHQGGEG